MCKKYYVSANITKYDNIAAFDEREYIYWYVPPKCKPFEVGSIIYLYTTPFYKTICMVGKVVETNLKSYTDDDNEYLIKDDSNLKARCYVKIKRIKFINNPSLTTSYIRNNILTKSRFNAWQEIKQGSEQLIESGATTSVNAEEAFGKGCLKISKLIRRYTFLGVDSKIYFTVKTKLYLDDKVEELHICDSFGIPIDVKQSPAKQKRIVLNKLFQLGLKNVDKNLDDNTLISILENKLKPVSNQEKYENTIFSSNINESLLKTKNESYLLSKSELTSIPLPKKYSTNNTYIERSAKQRVIAIQKFGDRCELNKNHKTFNNKNNSNQYIETHHLIPLSYQFKTTEDGNLMFCNSLDNWANLVCLCPLCHRKLHYAHFNEIKNDLIYLYNLRKEMLTKAGIPITLDELLKLYKNWLKN